MDGDLQRAFGLALREERVRQGYSQENWADVLGVHRTRAGAIERGEQNLTLRSVERLSQRVGIDPLVLLAGRIDDEAHEPVVLRAAHDGGEVDDDLGDRAPRRKAASTKEPRPGRTGRAKGKQPDAAASKSTRTRRTT